MGRQSAHGRSRADCVWLTHRSAWLQLTWGSAAVGAVWALRGWPIVAGQLVCACCAPGRRLPCRCSTAGCALHCRSRVPVCWLPTGEVQSTLLGCGIVEGSARCWVATVLEACAQELHPWRAACRQRTHGTQAPGVLDRRAPRCHHLRLSYLTFEWPSPHLCGLAPHGLAPAGPGCPCCLPGGPWGACQMRPAHARLPESSTGAPPPG
jgi:hypothetical protein